MRYVKARLGPSELMVVTKKRRRKWVTSRLLPWLRRFVSRIFVLIWRCFKQLVCMLTSQVIAAASKPPEVNPFLQDYMDDMDQNLILCRYSPQTQSVRNFYQGAQLTHLKQNLCDIEPYLRNIGKRPKYWYWPLKKKQLGTSHLVIYTRPTFTWASFLPVMNGLDLNEYQDICFNTHSTHCANIFQSRHTHIIIQKNIGVHDGTKPSFYAMIP